MKERIDERKNVQTTPTRTYCKCSRPLPYYNPDCRTPRHWKFTQHHRTTRPPPEPLGPAVQPNPIAPSPDPSDPTDPHFFFHGAPSQWDDSPTGRLLQEAREQAMAGIQNGYRVEFSERRCIQVTKTEMLTLPDGTEYSLISTWLTESPST